VHIARLLKEAAGEIQPAVAPRPAGTPASNREAPHEYLQGPRLCAPPDSRREVFPRAGLPSRDRRCWGVHAPPSGNARRRSPTQGRRIGRRESPAWGSCSPAQRGLFQPRSASPRASSRSRVGASARRAPAAPMEASWAPPSRRRRCLVCLGDAYERSEPRGQPPTAGAWAREPRERFDGPRRHLGLGLPSCSPNHRGSATCPVHPPRKGSGALDLAVQANGISRVGAPGTAPPTEGRPWSSTRGPGGRLTSPAAFEPSRTSCPRDPMSHPPRGTRDSTPGPEGPNTKGPWRAAVLPPKKKKK